MKILAVSDLHVDFHKDLGESIFAEIAAATFDVLVVAGDLSSYRTIRDALVRVTFAVYPRPVVYVLGNHEAYGGSIPRSRDRALEAEAGVPNLHVLEKSAVMIDGQRFVGCTLWFPHDDQPGEYDGCLGDFRYIADLYEDIGPEAASSRRFLEEAVRPGDIVVTHHLPHPRCIAPRYTGSPLNRFFLHNVASVVERGGARLWIHGHTHASVDVTCGGTRVVCNPLGYPHGQPGEPNADYTLQPIEVP